MYKEFIKKYSNLLTAEGNLTPLKESWEALEEFFGFDYEDDKLEVVFETGHVHVRDKSDNWENFQSYYLNLMPEKYLVIGSCYLFMSDYEEAHDLCMMIKGTVLKIKETFLALKKELPISAEREASEIIGIVDSLNSAGKKSFETVIDLLNLGTVTELLNSKGYKVTVENVPALDWEVIIKVSWS